MRASLLKKLRNLALLFVLVTQFGSGCWMMQALPGEGGTTDTDSDSDSDTDTETETDTWVDPHDTCNIDIVFVIDSSQSMMLTLNNLVQDGFSGFVNMLASYPQPGTIRVGVTNHLYGPKNIGGQSVDASAFMTRGWPLGVSHDIDGCQEVGHEDCDFASEKPWMEGPSGTLSSEFNCVGNLPCQEDLSVGEPTLQAGLESLLWDANADFIRDDALLFMVFITDEDDQSPMDREDIYDGIMAAKDDESLTIPVEEYVYVATIAGPENGGCNNGDFFGETDPTPEVIAFTAQFGGNGRHFDMCATSIESALGSMSSLMQNGCQDVFDL